MYEARLYMPPVTISFLSLIKLLNGFCESQVFHRENDVLVNRNEDHIVGVIRIASRFPHDSARNPNCRKYRRYEREVRVGKATPVKLRLGRESLGNRDSEEERAMCSR